MKKAKYDSSLISPWEHPQRAKARLFALGRSSILGQIRASAFAGFAVFWLWALVSPVLGHAFTPSLQYEHVIYSDSELEPSGGVELELLTKKFYPFSLNLSYESTLLVLGGQEAADIDLFGVGLAVKLPQRYFVLQLGASWYFPDVSYKRSFGEAMYLHINHVFPEGKGYADYNDLFTYELHGNLGAYVKLDFNYEITKTLWLNFSVGYRYLSLMEHYLRRDTEPEQLGQWVEFINYRDFSGGIVFIGVTKRF